MASLVFLLSTSGTHWSQRKKRRQLCSRWLKCLDNCRQELRHV